MGILRNLTSFVLLVCAAASGILGAVAQWGHHTATTPGVLPNIVAPISSDAMVQRAVTDSLTELTTDQVPTIAEAVPGLTEHLNTLIGQAVTAVLADEDVDQAWRESLENTRVGVMADLEAYRADPSAPPTLWFDLAPFVDLTASKLGSLTGDDRVRVFIEEMEWSSDPRVPLGRPEAEQLEQVNLVLDVAEQWPWFYAASAVLLILGLMIGTRKGRWACLAVSSLLAAGVLAVGDWILEAIHLSGGSTLGSAVANAIADGATDALAEALAPGVWIALGVAGVALVALLIAAITGRSRQRL